MGKRVDDTAELPLVQCLIVHQIGPLAPLVLAEPASLQSQIRVPQWQHFLNAFLLLSALQNSHPTRPKERAFPARWESALDAAPLLARQGGG